MENLSIFEALGRKRLEQLDGLRGICALGVLINHLIFASYTVKQNIDFYPSLFFKSISIFGHVAVLIFFVLSGFVIGYTTPQKFTCKEAINYLLRRFIRLYPIYLFAVFFTFAFTETPYKVMDMIGHLLFMQGWLVPVMKINSPLWTLHYEFMFYLLFLLMWGLNIKINKAIFVCILSAILSSIFRFHPFEILGYFTLWLCGLWLAKNMANFKLISIKDFIPYTVWLSYILMAAFASQNIWTMAINKYGTSSSVLPDIILAVLATSSVAALIIENNFYWYNMSFFVAFTSTIITIIHSCRQHTFYSLNGLLLGYQSAACFLFLLPFTLLVKKIPISVLTKFKNIGSFSYALYVIHHPIIVIVFHLMSNNLKSKFIFGIANLISVVLSLLLAWFLECYLQVNIAKQLKSKLKLV